MLRAIALLVAVAVAAPSHAADDVGTARKLFQSGTKHFDLGEYEQALADFKEAYRIKDDPVLLYNIGQALRMLKRNDEALRAYKTYLSRSSDQTHRGDVEQKIAALQEAVDKQNRATEIPPHDVLHNGADNAPSPPTPPNQTTLSTNNIVAEKTQPQPVYKKWWVWTIVGGVVVAGVAVGLGVGLSRGNGGNVFPSVGY
jgi:tetratricopeptide (TPR) repeat protein